MRPITVLLAEDHTVVREGLRALLEAEDDIEVVGEAETGRQAVERTRALRPAVVVMDIAMPQLNGMEATRQILKVLPTTKVLILSAHGDNAYIERVTALGAAGFLLKQTSAHILARTVREVHKGKTLLDPAIVRRRRGHPHEKSSTRAKAFGKKGLGLTSREMEVLQRIAEGEANKQIAAGLGISIKTVEKHRDNLMKKLNIHDIAGLTRYAIGAGII
jgi:DNA-binding NarL/FixJ family response regulator